jgi:dolichol-phosphate mannosyltransferase
MTNIAENRSREQPSLSIILPTYNEGENIVALVGEVFRFAAPDAEVLVVDDNSPDGTGHLVGTAFQDCPRLRVIVRTEDRGFANSIRAGIQNARGLRVLVMDSDFNHAPRMIPALAGIAQFTDIASGSRFVPGGGMEDRKRYWASFIYNVAIRVLLGTKVRDNLCGFFVIRRATLLELPLDEIFFGFGDYYFRLIYCAQRMGWGIIEVPIFMPLRRGGSAKNRVFFTFFQYSTNLLRFRQRLRMVRRALSEHCHAQPADYGEASSSRLPDG